MKPIVRVSFGFPLPPVPLVLQPGRRANTARADSEPSRRADRGIFMEYPFQERTRSSSEPAGVACFRGLARTLPPREMRAAKAWHLTDGDETRASRQSP